MDNWALLETTTHPQFSHIVIVIKTKQSNCKPENELSPRTSWTALEKYVVGWEKCPPEVKEGWFRIGYNEYSSTRPEKPCDPGMRRF